MIELEDYIDDMEGSTYKIIKNKKKINIRCSVFEGNKKKYGLISVAEVTKMQKFEKERMVHIFKTMYLHSIA